MDTTLVTMDNITVLTPATADAGPPADCPPIVPAITIEPLDSVEVPKVRTQLRIYTILVALYVHYPVLAVREH
jgi:hypothetical protein